jgi:hypothetical protein
MEQNRDDFFGTPRPNVSDAQSTGTYRGTGAERTERSEGGVLDSARQMASGLMDQVKDQAATQARDKKQTVASSLHSVADAFRQLSEGLSQQNTGPVAKYAADLGRAVGNQADSFSRYMEGRDVREIADDLHDFARRKPAVFLGGALVLGLAVSRFLKSSRPTRSTRYDPSDYERLRMGPEGRGYTGSSSPDIPSPSGGLSGVQSWPANPTGVSPTATDPSVSGLSTQAGSYDSADRGSDDKLER